MKSVVVMNPKGGAGKTTASTTIASALAHRGMQVRLQDLDRQKSAIAWLGLRAAELPTIEAVDAEMRMRTRADWLVVDSPAGLHGKNLGHALKLADKVIVPVQPSLFDMAATSDFLQALHGERIGRKGGADVAIVGVRVDPRTRAAATLQTFLGQFDLPVLEWLQR
jgi:chromosome partitioning protein